MSIHTCFGRLHHGCSQCRCSPSRRQLAARHADARTTTVNDHRRQGLDRHAGRGCIRQRRVVRHCLAEASTYRSVTVRHLGVMHLLDITASKWGAPERNGRGVTGHHQSADRRFRWSTGPQAWILPECSVRPSFGVQGQLAAETRRKHLSGLASLIRIPHESLAVSKA